MTKYQLVSDVPSTPCFEILTELYSLSVSAVFGKMYKYSLMSNGLCEASRERIAKELNLSVSSVKRAIQILKNEHLITDMTPHFRRRSRMYKVNQDELFVMYNTIKKST